MPVTEWGGVGSLLAKREETIYISGSCVPSLQYGKLNLVPRDDRVR